MNLRTKKTDNGSVPVNFVNTPGYGVENSVVDDHEMALSGEGLSRSTNGGIEAEGLYKGAEVPREAVEIASLTDLAVEGVLEEGREGGVLDLSGDTSMSVDKNQEVGAQITEDITKTETEPGMKRADTELLDWDKGLESSRGEDITEEDKIESTSPIEEGVNQSEVMDKGSEEQFSDSEVSNTPESGEVFNAVENDENVIAAKKELEEARRNLLEKRKEVEEVIDKTKSLGVDRGNITVLNQELEDCESVVAQKEEELKDVIAEAEKRIEISKVGGKFEAVIKKDLGSALKEVINEAAPELSALETDQEIGKLFEKIIEDIRSKLITDGMPDDEITPAIMIQIQSWQKNGDTVVVKKDAEGKLTASVIATENKAMKDSAADDYNYQMAA